MSSSPTTPRAEDRADRPGTHAAREAGPGADGSSPWSQPWSQVARPQLLVALGLIALFGALRAWALFPSWFYGDDFAMIRQAQSGLSVDYLFRAYGIHVMPVGRVIAWGAAESGGLNWGFVASSTLILQLLAALAFAWMVFTLFGERWGSVGLLLLYLTTAISVPATMWWAAVLNQTPQQLAMCVAIGGWVRYLRGRRLVWLAVTVAATVLGLLAYVKSALLLPLLALILLSYFATGRRRRIQDALRRYWSAALVFLVLGGAFVVYYVTQVPSVGDERAGIKVTDLVDTMVVRSFGTGVVGGPWHWENFNPPVALVDPPLWTSTLGWVLMAAVAGWLFATRARSGRAWLILLVHLLGSFALVLFSRATVVGAVVGLELRYLTDMAVVFPLCLGLASMRLIGAPESSEPRPTPLVTVSLPRWLTPGLAGAVAVLGLFSTLQYVHFWHTTNEAESFAQKVRDEVGAEPIDLIDNVVPEVVMPGGSYPYNRYSEMLPLLDIDAHFPEISTRLQLLDEAGAPHGVLIDAVSEATDGPRPGCGWLASSSSPALVTLNQPAGEWDWWTRLGITSSQDARVTVRAGDTERVATIRQGVSSLYAFTPGEISSVEIEVETRGVQVCISDVQVGNPVLGAAS